MSINKQQKTRLKNIGTQISDLLKKIDEYNERPLYDAVFLDDLKKQVNGNNRAIIKMLPFFYKKSITEIEINEKLELFEKNIRALNEILNSKIELVDKKSKNVSQNVDNLSDLEPAGDGLPFFPSEDENEFTLAKNQITANLAMILNKIGGESLAFPLLNNFLELIKKVEKPEELAKIDMQKMVNQNIFASDPVQDYKKKAINELKIFLEQNPELQDAKELYDVYSAKINVAATEGEIKQCGEEVRAETRKRILLPASAAYKEQVINELKKLLEQNLESDDVNELYETYSIQISTAETVHMVNQCREEAWRDIQERAELAAALAMSLTF